MEKIKVCPFCGSSVIAYGYLPGPTTTIPRRYYLSCMECKSRGPVDYNKIKSLEKWNNRKR